ncbi:hypothetical protein H4S02_007387, partial [Coemansia sp. RSA 2611]
MDSVEAFSRDTERSGQGRSNTTLVSKLVQDSTESVAWLQQEFELDLDVLAQLGGHSAPRTHRRPEKNGKPQPVGWGIVSALSQRLAKHAQDGSGRFQLVTGARVTKLLAANDGGVAGTVYETVDTTTQRAQQHQLLSDVVVLATGGFAGEGTRPGFLSQYAPHLVGLASTNGPFATGDGLQMATALGAELVDMDQVQVHPTGFVKADDPDGLTKFLAAEALRGEGGILLDASGKRFVNELDTRDRVADAVFHHCAARNTRAQHGSTGREEGPRAAAFLVLSQTAADRFGYGALGFYERMGLISRAAGLTELATALRVDKSVLRQTLETYDRARDSGEPDELGKSVFPAAMAAADVYFWG